VSEGRLFKAKAAGPPVSGRREEARAHAANDETAGTLGGGARENSAKQRARTPARADDGSAGSVCRLAACWSIAQWDESARRAREKAKS
jgi:hypothetical protein